MKTARERIAIAKELIYRADTVAILTETEVEHIYRRALDGAFDDVFKGDAEFDALKWMHVKFEIAEPTIITDDSTEVQY